MQEELDGMIEEERTIWVVSNAGVNKRDALDGTLQRGDSSLPKGAGKRRAIKA